MIRLIGLPTPPAYLKYESRINFKVPTLFRVALLPVCAVLYLAGQTHA